MSCLPIWHPDGGQLLLLRDRLALRGPYRGARLRCAASGPFQLYLDGMRVAGAPGGGAARNPLWHPVTLTGVWDTGRHELIAVVAAGPNGARQWFACEGQLEPAVEGGPGHPIESGRHWQALALPPPPRAAAAVDERYSALEDPRHLAAAWVGVQALTDIAVAGEAPAAQERIVLARQVRAFAETHASAQLSFAPEAASSARCKCVHRDGLLAADAGTPTVRTAPERAIAFVLDFGRIVTGYPVLRVRGGQGGVIELGLATAWGHIERVLCYVCGAGRQEWFALAPARCRYAVVRLANFDEECQIERIAIAERFVPADARGVELAVSHAYDQVWAVGLPSQQGARTDFYGPRQAQAPCDWLSTTALLLDDAVRTGHTDTARATLIGCAPDVQRPGPEDVAFALCLEAYHLYVGDDATADRLLDAAVALATAASGASGDGPPAPQAALGAAAAAATARLCQRRNRPRQADLCLEAHADLAQRLEAFWRPVSGLYADGVAGGDRFGRWTNALALLSGAVPPERVATVATALRGTEVAPVADLCQAFYLAEALWQAGQGARGLDVVKNQWLRIVEREGPTWRDKRGAEADRAAPGPDYLLARRLLGIAPLTPGFARRQVRPALSLSRRARGRLRMPTGWITVSWRTRDADEDGGRTTVGLEVEGDGVTELALERGARRNPTFGVNGEAVWRNEKIYPNPSVHEVVAEEDAVVLVFQRSGTWEVTLE